MEEARLIARAACEPRYRSEKPCPRGHRKIWRYTSNAICVQCDNDVLAPRRREKKRATWKPKTVTGICQHCGKQYEKTNNANFYCSIECRFWSKVDKRGPDDCWLWTAGTGTDGHGQFNFTGSREDRLSISAHRVSYAWANGTNVERTGQHKWGEDFLCHKCDVPNCVNPSHLYMGNHATNMRDVTMRHRKHKYIDRIGEVIALHKSGMLRTYIARKTRIPFDAVARIVAGTYLNMSLREWRETRKR